MVLSLKSAYDIAKLYSKLLIIGFVLFLLSSIISIYSTSPVVAQTPETSSSTTAPGLPTIQITTPQDGQQVPQENLRYREYLQTTKKPIVRCMLMSMT